ncbi:MAG: ATP citrate lyase citrate-binding domain-containing protein [Candidatus Thermoplasmatota archaeon]|nr:ATP citrate lyase citrate-binding domain-containing protein [Candidatus Thermoplasmatota archaeon]
MAQRGIREVDAKLMLAKYLPEFSGGKVKYHGKIALVTAETDFKKLAKENPWLEKEKIVVKPDMLFGKRGKNKLLLVGADYAQAQKWLKEKMKGDAVVHKKFDKKDKPLDDGIKAPLTHFLIEPMTPHDEKEEYYVAIKDGREEDIIYFSMQGGIYVEENWDKVIQIPVSIGEDIDKLKFETKLPKELKGDKQKAVAQFIRALYKFYTNLGYTYLEINPFTFHKGDIVPLDTVAKVDDTAAFECQKYWGNMEFPAPFGRKLSKEENYIKKLDEKSGSSLKLTILNPDGRVWTMVAGGGASVIYADTVVDMGFGKELANYGEYSGNPTTDETYEYAKTVLDLMTRKKHPKGKFLLIGGGIANFTDVAKTFTGIVMALEEYKAKLKEHKVKIYVRRAGPNYKEGLKTMRDVGARLGVPIEVYGPETHMTKIVSMALVGGK